MCKENIYDLFIIYCQNYSDLRKESCGFSTPLPHDFKHLENHSFDSERDRDIQRDVIRKCDQDVIRKWQYGMVLTREMVSCII